MTILVMLLISNQANIYENSKGERKFEEIGDQDLVLPGQILDLYRLSSIEKGKVNVSEVRNFFSVKFFIPRNDCFFRETIPSHIYIYIYIYIIHLSLY